jgi:hypothetical protein
MIEASDPVPPKILAITLFPVEPSSTVKVALPESAENVRFLAAVVVAFAFCKFNVVFASLVALNVIDLINKGELAPATILETLVVPAQMRSVVLLCVGATPPLQFVAVVHQLLVVPVQV